MIILLPAAIVFLTFFILPMARLALESVRGPEGARVYLTMLTTGRYLKTLVYTIGLSLGVTVVTLIISGLTGVFLPGTGSGARTCWWRP